MIVANECFCYVMSNQRVIFESDQITSIHAIIYFSCFHKTLLYIVITEFSFNHHLSKLYMPLIIF